MSQARKPLLWIGIPVLIAMSVTHVYDQRPILAQEAKPQAGFAVVELFTSEGCSSCPPADELLAEVTQDAEKNGQRLYALAFHVQYWDHIGWEDPYGLKQAKQRQARYARAMRLRSLYTPQMIVNGETEFVGSSRSKARMAIGAALAKREQAKVTLAVKPSKDGKSLTVDYTTRGTTEGAVLCLALTESGLSSKVTRGENRGSTLKHDNVVRAFTTVKLKAVSGKASLAVPAGVRLQAAQIVGFVQDAKTYRIRGAVLASATGK